MPIVNLQIPAGRDAQARKELLKGTSQALQQTVNAKPERVRVSIVEIDSDNIMFLDKPGQEGVLVDVSWLTGKTQEQKENFYKAITDVIQDKLNVPKEHVIVIARTIEPQDLCFGNNISAYAMMQNANK